MTGQTRFGLTDDEFRSVESWESSEATVTPSLAAIYRFDRYRAGQRALPKHWQAETLRAVLGLTKLKDNWNSYGAKAIRYDTALFAMLVLESVMRFDTPLPAVVPTSTGGIQFEWHEQGLDLEVKVSGPNRCEYWHEDSRGELPESSGRLENDFFALERPIAILSSRAEPVRRSA